MVNVLSKITTQHNAPNNAKDHDTHASSTISSPAQGKKSKNVMIPPPLTTDTVQHNEKQVSANSQLSESAIRFRSLECLVAVLQSLVSWYANGSVSVTAGSRSEDDQSSGTTPRESEDTNGGNRITNHSNASGARLSPGISGNNNSSSNVSTPPLDDPEQFENLKHRKQILQEGVRQFNWKPKKGIQLLASNGFVDINDHQNVARFLLNTEGLSKMQIGEFLGEG